MTLLLVMVSAACLLAAAVLLQIWLDDRKWRMLAKKQPFGGE
jgi:hypothetical protein